MTTIAEITPLIAPISAVIAIGVMVGRQRQINSAQENDRRETQAELNAQAERLRVLEIDNADTRATLRGMVDSVEKQLGYMTNQLSEIFRRLNNDK